MWDLFWSNMTACGVDDLITALCMTSVHAARQFSDGSLDFVLIDADHANEAVRADILAWRPRMKPDGLFAGHDWNTYDSVRRAVTEILGDHVRGDGNCWVA